MVKKTDSVYLYNTTTCEYFSLGTGWESMEDVINYARDEGYINIEEHEGVIGVEEKILND